MRHAKSSWDDPGLDDHDRPLAPRGQRAVKRLHDYVRAHQIEPALVLCSTSRRTRETLEGVAPSGEHVLEPELYGANAAAILERLHELPPDTGSAMVIGHNPAMQILVMRLAAGTPSGDDDLATVQRKFPTGALATLTFQCEWRELAPDCATLTGLARPKDLNLAPSP